MGIRRVLRLLLSLAAVMGLYSGYLVATENFHAVVPGKLYRSAQPSANNIALWHDRHGIKTIINLRGANPKQRWYQDERAAAEASGIKLIDYGMSPKRDVSAVEVEELLGLLATAEPPILIHCRNGADRSGLVSALYVASMGGSEFYSELQMSPIYGHLPLWFLSAFAMDRSFERVEARLGFPNS
jgi:protein tyrosine/serine phosphatase